ncbi:MAG: hypothetical protein JXR37_01900 [Kiritimatiellae bacterium]|nr:hypothetical protein [Kiritimatiellia bacterium]
MNCARSNERPRNLCQFAFFFALATGVSATGIAHASDAPRTPTTNDWVIYTYRVEGCVRQDGTEASWRVAGRVAITHDQSSVRLSVDEASVTGSSRVAFLIAFAVSLVLRRRAGKRN